MPFTKAITEEKELDLIEIFDPKASRQLKQALKEGKKVEKEMSLFDDTGEDYVKFKVDGTEVCHIKGY